MARLKRMILPMYLGFGLLYLFLPVLVVILFSFNDNQGRFNVRWQGFTLRHWLDPFRVDGGAKGSPGQHRRGADQLGYRHSNRHFDCARPYPLSLSGPGAHQHLALLSDGDSRGGDGLFATRSVCRYPVQHRMGDR